MKTAMKDRYNEYLQKFKEATPQEVQSKMKNAIDDLKNSDDGKGLKEGDKAPDFSLPDPNGNQVNLSNQLDVGPVILTFYRGGWCPYCNMELKEYQRILSEIHDAGGELIAISPQTPDYSLSTAQKNELNFHVLSDRGNKVARDYQLVYPVPDYLAEIYKEKGLDVDLHNGDESWELPAAATYVIDREGTIVFEYTKADYKDRAEPWEVLEVLKEKTK
ncbi:peroxiredoxin-like family protein [Halobacillus sp. A5]|uniref:peroxiredoxin-like family protein n=1 Tax=Halobacillus sp. A5 TaxID=2880263 RepID=UPI0020A6BDE2|nr:peroxiredoxin-like family protein [Halobacillus sp. A5]MCP3029123.1 AhpC/TSA family protein [Halobacillus sp. A5]